MQPLVTGLTVESFWMLPLDAKNRIIDRPRRITVGLVDASLAHPREVFGVAIQARATAIVLAHNHPSSDPTPSAEDIRITRQMVEAGRVIDIKVMARHTHCRRLSDRSGRRYAWPRSCSTAEGVTRLRLKN